MFAADDRDERDARIGDAARDRHRRRARRGRGAAVPARRAATGRATAWPCCPRRATARSARALVRFAVATAGERGGARMVAHDPAAQRGASSSRSAGSATGDAVAFHGRPHQPMAIALSARRVSGSAARSHTSADSPPPASRSTRESSKAPHGAQARPRRAKASHAASTCSGAAARTKPKLGKVSSQRSSATPSGRGRRSTSSVRAAAGQLEQLQQRAGHARHRDVAGGVAEPALGDLDERLAVLAQLRRVALAQRAPDRRVVAAIAALAGRRRRGARRRAARPLRAAAWSRCRCRRPTAPPAAPSVRWPPTTGTPSRWAAHASPSSTLLGVRRGRGSTSVSTSASGRPPMARTSATLVATAAAPAANGSAASSAGAMASPQSDELAVAVGDERGVVAVAREAVALEQRAARAWPAGRARRGRRRRDERGRA